MSTLQWILVGLATAVILFFTVLPAVPILYRTVHRVATA